MTGAATLFSSSAQAAAYSLNRPTYPAELYQALLSFCSGRSLAVDIATGSGQAATALAGSFKRVIAQDGSKEQLDHANTQFNNVEYQRADAHSTGLPDQCADLVTVAQALHWFDHPKFYREVRRILKPDGCFAAWTYGLPVLCSQHHPAQGALHHLYEDVLGPYWSQGRRHVERGYVGIEPMVPDDFDSVKRLAFKDTKTLRVDDVVGYVSSWSAYHTFLKKHPGQDPVEDFKQQLMAALDTSDGSTGLAVIFPITLVVANNPTPLTVHP